jgi:DNA-binding MarR family transcriptional regulator
MDEISEMGTIFLLRRRFLGERLRGYGISVKQLQLIRIARRRGSVSPSDAALEMFCDRPTASVIVKNCLGKGWLRRRKSRSDGRSQVLVLSGAGEELIDRIDRMEASRPAALAEALESLEPAERAQFRAALDKVLVRASAIYGEIDASADPR